MMQLKTVQKILAQAATGPPNAVEALKELRVSVERALDYLKEGHTAKAQVFLEQGFTSMMAAFHYLNLDVEQVVEREQLRRKTGQIASQDRVILIFSDHAELRVSGELRGTIPLYSQDDYQELRQISQIFDCRIEHADHLQLDLFSRLRSESK